MKRKVERDSSVQAKSGISFSADFTVGFELLLLLYCGFFFLSCIAVGHYSAVLQYTKHVQKTKD